MAKQKQVCEERPHVQSSHVRWLPRNGKFHRQAKDTDTYSYTEASLMGPMDPIGPWGTGHMPPMGPTDSMDPMDHMGPWAVGPMGN